MNKCIGALRRPDEAADRRLEALQTLIDWCEDINLANDFIRMGHLALIKELLKSENPDIRISVCELIATVAQNNPYSQEYLLEGELLDSLVGIMKESDSSADLRVKCMHAISCLIRDSESKRVSSLDHSLLDIIILNVNSSTEKLRIKSIFLLSWLCRNVTIREKLISKNLIGKLTEIYALNVKCTKSFINEPIMMCLSELLLPESDQRTAGLHPLLSSIDQRLQVIENNEEYSNERALTIEVQRRSLER